MKTGMCGRIALGAILAATLCLATTATRAVDVIFEDENLGTAVRASGGQEVSWRPATDESMLNMVVLEGLSHLEVFSLSGLEYALNLEAMVLPGGTVSDLTPIAGLTKLTWVDLADNAVEDLSPLVGLSELEVLILSGNEIRDISDLATLTKLWWLYLEDNEIRDVSALASLTGLGKLHLQGNPLDRESHDVWLPMIAANNPGVDLRYDPWGPDGDANSDGVVDLDDFVILKTHFGGAGGWDDGDFNGDGAIDLDDFVILKNNFGATDEF